ncbi:MAG: hypothetical protein Q9174_004252, partial [Haloplaca sp. 1 TL-2023]
LELELHRSRWISTAISFTQRLCLEEQSHRGTRGTKDHVDYSPQCVPYTRTMYSASISDDSAAQSLHVHFLLEQRGIGDVIPSSRRLPGSQVVTAA